MLGVDVERSPAPSASISSIPFINSWDQWSLQFSSLILGQLGSIFQFSTVGRQLGLAWVNCVWQVVRRFSKHKYCAL